MGVRAPATITTSVGNIISSLIRSLELGAFQRHDGVAAPFARLFHADFGAIDQVCNNILALVIRFGHRLDNSCARGHFLRFPPPPLPASPPSHLIVNLPAP